MKKGKTLYTVLGVFCVVVILAALYTCLFSSLNNGEETTYIYIDEDDNCDSVFAKIAPAAAPQAMSGFTTIARHTDYGENIKTGRYEIAPGDGPLTVFRRLKRGQQTPMRLTIPSVRTMDDLAAYLGEKLMIDSTRWAETFHSDSLCQSLGYDTATIACLFIPNTYELYWNVSIDKFMERMQKENDAFWNSERTAQAEACEMTKNEVITLASIVDEETANNAEKPMVAGMYINRLKQNIPLQADPTVKFALKDFGLKRIYQKHLSVKSPYNTYVNEGLPPGPIRIPTVAGIDAVLKHTKHNYLYMCAKEDFSGTHNFATTYSEHLANAAKYVKALNQKNIK